MSKNKFLVEFFALTKNERYGIGVLLFLLLIAIGIRISIPLLNKQPDTDYSQFESKINSFNDEVQPDAEPMPADTTAKAKEMYAFDPNTVILDDLLAFGIDPKTAKTFINFRTKAGKFKKAEDIKKIYGISDSLYQALLPYMVFEPEVTETYSKPATNKDYHINQTELQAQSIDLNTADITELEKLPGIGKIYAARIIKYRNLLGGFASIDQLLEVYGMTPESYEKIKNYVFADVFEIKKININTDDFKAIVSHPYIDKETTVKILDYRKRAGKIKSLSELKENALISQEVYEKINYYLTVE